MLSKEERQRWVEDMAGDPNFYRFNRLATELEAAEAREAASRNEWDIEAAGIREELSKATVECLQADVRITELEAERDALREETQTLRRIASYLPAMGKP